MCAIDSEFINFGNFLVVDLCILTPSLVLLLLSHLRTVMTVDEPMSSQPKSVSLAGILDADADEEIDLPESQHEKAAGWDEAEGLTAKEGYCIECEGAFQIHSGQTKVLIQGCGRPAGPTSL